MIDAKKLKSLFPLFVVAVFAVLLSVWLTTAGADSLQSTVAESPLRPPKQTPIGGFPTPDPNITPVVVKVVVEAATTLMSPLPTPTRIPDYTPPTTICQPEGMAGDHGWFISAPVTVTLSATDDTEVALTEYRLNASETWTRYCSPFGINDDGLHLLEFRSVDKLLNVEGVQSTAIKIDTMPPTVQIVEPLAITYTQGATFTLIYTVDDAVSGIENVVALLDGAVVTNGQFVDTFFLSPGPHTVGVTATDVAGWTVSDSRVFTVEVTISSLVALKHRLYDMGEIYGPGAKGIVKSLDAKLDTAQAALDKGQVKAAIKRLEAFIAEVQAQTGKHITPWGAEKLIEGAQYVVEQNE